MITRPHQTPKLAMITGAGEGLGNALARLILLAGGKVVAIDIDAEKIARLKREFPDQCISITADLSNLDAQEELNQQIEKINQQFGKFNLVIFNAGISATGHFEKIPAHIHQKIMSLNAASPMMMSATLMQNNAFAQGAAVVFISSLSHQTGYPGAASYAASKDVVAIYAKSIVRAYSRRKVHVMTVFPGPIATRMAARHSPNPDKKSNRQHPDKVAMRILRAASRGQSVLYPNIAARIIATIGHYLPGPLTKLMRRVLFEKMDGEVF